MKQALALAVWLTGACSYQAPSNERLASSRADDMSEEVKNIEQCLSKNNRWSKCLDFGSPQRMHGVWYTGFEESGFVANVDSVPLVRDINGDASSFATELEIDAKAVMRKIGQPEMERCIRAVALDFVGRQADMPGPDTGHVDRVMIVDRLLSARLLGRVRTRGLPGYDEQCASPAPSEAQMRAMDEAELKRCEAAGQCISWQKLDEMRKPKK